MIECEKGAVTGLCTSDGQYDCAGDIQRISCNYNVKVNKAKCSSVAQTEDSSDRAEARYKLKPAKCPAGQVMVGRSASGDKKEAELGGKLYWNVIKCCEVTSLVKYSMPVDSFKLVLERNVYEDGFAGVEKSITWAEGFHITATRDENYKNN